MFLSVNRHNGCFTFPGHMMATFQAQINYLVIQAWTGLPHSLIILVFFWLILPIFIILLWITVVYDITRNNSQNGVFQRVIFSEFPSWFLVGFISTAPRQELLGNSFLITRIFRYSDIPRKLLAGLESKSGSFLVNEESKEKGVNCFERELIQVLVRPDK